MSKHSGSRGRGWGRGTLRGGNSHKTAMNFPSPPWSSTLDRFIRTSISKLGLLLHQSWWRYTPVSWSSRLPERGKEGAVLCDTVTCDTEWLSSEHLRIHHTSHVSLRTISTTNTFYMKQYAITVVCHNPLSHNMPPSCHILGRRTPPCTSNRLGRCHLLLPASNGGSC